MLTLNIIGCGKLGRTLGRLWTRQRQFQVQDVASGSLASAASACEFIQAGTAVALPGAMRSADCWLLATPDDLIAATAAQLAATDQVKADNLVFHCSGALSSDTLAALARRTIHLASVHPVHSFASPARSVSTFAGSYCACEGESTALATLQPGFEAIGANMITIQAADKVHYHAASVIACNYLVALLDASQECYANAGIDAAMAARILLPIVHQTVDNCLLQSTEQALTGPIARGDAITVERQLQALSSRSELLGELYRSLGLQTLKIARRGHPPAPALDSIESVLTAAPRTPPGK